MAIHHAVIKRAEKAGIRLEDLGEDENRDERYKAFWPEYNQVVFGSDPKVVLDDMMCIREMRKNYQSFGVEIQDDNTVNITVRGTDISVKGMRATAAFGVAKKAWIEARAELDIDDEEADNEVEAEIDAEHEKDEEERVGSVVGETYRARYAEAGHPNTCGDWLATIIDNICKNNAGFDLELFEAVCNANGVSLAKYNRETKGWRGRLRMTGRNLLAKIVFINGELRLPETINGGEPYKAPGDWKAAQRLKSPAPPAPRTPVKE